MGFEDAICQWGNPLYNGIMSKATLDQAGRVVLPKPLRAELRLSAGDVFDVSVEGDAVTLRPRRAATPLQKERGVWVLRIGVPITAAETDQALRDLRLERHRRLSGEKP